MQTAYNLKDHINLQVTDHLTCPLLGMIGELQRRQQELVRLLKLKDKEIDDYKIQGGKVTRSKFYDIFMFLRSLCSYKVFKTSAIRKTLCTEL